MNPCGAPPRPFAPAGAPAGTAAQAGACAGVRQCLRHGCGAAGASVIVRATRGRELLDGAAEGATPGTAQAKGPPTQQNLESDVTGAQGAGVSTEGARQPQHLYIEGCALQSLRYKGQMGRAGEEVARPLFFTLTERHRDDYRCPNRPPSTPPTSPLAHAWSISPAGTCR
jgi:hypothetical protein